jgi:type III pantothenate kinase
MQDNKDLNTMNLIIDIGNTQVKTAVFDTDNELIDLQKNTTENILKDIEHQVDKFAVTYAIMSKVGKEIEGLESFFEAQAIPLFFLTAHCKLPFSLQYKTPETIGADRLALVAGALLYRQNQNMLIIDAGTCVTYDFIDKNNVYHGGAISPGLFLRYKSLNDYTANLPLLKPENKTVELIGDSTQSSIQSGVIYGLVAEIEAIIVKYNLKFKDLTVFLTGGDKKLLDSYIKNKIFVNSNFLLPEGMNYILNLNK